MINPLNWFRDSTDDAQSNVNELELEQVEWYEETEQTHEIVTERLVWPGGAEREIEHCPQNSMYPDQYHDIDGYQIVQIEARPAYTEEKAREEVTRTEERRRTAFVYGSIPGGVEKTGRTKTVHEVLE